MEDGVKRKLPPWMSRAVITSNTVGQSEAEKGVCIDSYLKDEASSQLLLPKPKAKAKLIKKDSFMAYETLDNEPKKRKRRTLKQGEGESNVVESCETLVERKRGRSGGIKTKNRKERNRERSDEAESPSNEDDGELTVEDLLTIAKEYVRDESLGKQYLSDGCGNGKTNQAIAFSVRDSGGLPYVPPQSNKKPLMPEETIFVHNSIVRTEDPAQDMLDLFLGPLLNKPESVDRVIKTIEEDKTFAREVKEQVNDNGIAMADFVPLTKKKSSLKDKMFFD